MSALRLKADVAHNRHGCPLCAIGGPPDPALCVEVGLRRSVGPDVDFAAPSFLIFSTLGNPVKRVYLDFSEGPAHDASASRVRAFLHDVAAPRAPNLLRGNICRGVIPEDPPSVEIGIIEFRSVVPYQLPAPGK